MSTYLLFYRGGLNRLAELYTINQAAGLSKVNSYSDFAPDWEKIVPVECVWDIFDRKLRSDVLFYGAKNPDSTLYGGMYRVDSPGEIKHLRNHNVLTKHWTDIISIPFEFHTNILFYDRSTGTGEVRRYISSRQPHPDFDESGAMRGEGNLPILQTYSNFSPSWTHIVHGNFGGEYGGLLFYDQQAGTGSVYRMEKNGILQKLKTYTDFSTGWTHIVPIPFGFRTDLFFYDKTTRSAEIYRLGDQGNLELIKSYPAASLGEWSQIVVIPFEDDFRGPLLFFYNGVETGMFYKINGLGELNLVKSDTSYSQGWSHIVVIPGYMPPPVYRIRMRAVLGCNENDPGDLQATVEHSEKHLPKMVAGANRIFKEAGICLEFDPLTDADIVPSQILNHDILPDDSTNCKLDPVTDLGIWEGAAVAEQIGWRCRNKLVVIFRGYLRGANYSTFCQQEVVFGKGDDDGRTLAHEMGHYFRLVHTFVAYGPADFEKLKDAIKTWVESQPEAKAAIANKLPIPEDLFESIVWQNTDADRQTNLANQEVSDTPPDLGPDVFRWTHVVPVGSDAVLFYDGRTGEAAIQRLYSDGTLENLHRFSDFSRNWTHIVGVSGNLIFFYKSHKGEGVVMRLNNDGTLTKLQEYTDFSLNWTHIVGASGDLVFFYKSHKGEGAVMRLNSGDGTLTAVGPEYPENSFAPGWTQIIASEGGLIFFYMADQGTGAVLRLESDGKFTVLPECPKDIFPHDCTQITASEGGLIFFYKAVQGTGAILRLNSNGAFTIVEEYSAMNSFGTDWSHIAAAHDRLVIYYNDWMGTSVTQKLQNDGTFLTLQSYDDPAEYKCTGTLRVVVNFSTGQKHTYAFNPDCSNAMGYYHQLSGSGPFHFSPHQIHVMRHALQHENRRHLVGPHEFMIKDCLGCP